MLDKKTASQCISSDYCRGWNDAVEDMPRWISVEERLPEDMKDVLVYRDGCFAIACIFMEDNWSYCGLGGDPTHWLPLPEPPKEEEK